MHFSSSFFLDLKMDQSNLILSITLFSSPSYLLIGSEIHRLSQDGSSNTTVISQNGNSYTIGNNLSYYQCGASTNHEHGNVEKLIICKLTSHWQMKEPQQQDDLYSPSRLGKCSNIEHKIDVFRK